MPLLRYPYLEYDGREIMRSLADALTKLRELGNLSDRENVEIKTTGIRLPDGRLSGIVSVLGPQQQDGPQEAWTDEAERRTHSNKQRDKLLAIIRRFGFINPIIVEENDNVIAGHSILSV